MEKTRRYQIGDVCEEEFAFFQGCINALLMVSPFYFAIAVILVW